MRVYDEFVDFLVENVNPDALAKFAPSLPVAERVAEMREREKTTELLPEERAELERFRAIEHVMRLARARLRQRFLSE